MYVLLIIINIYNIYHYHQFYYSLQIICHIYIYVSLDYTYVRNYVYNIIYMVWYVDM